jgi:hypothetical protein
MAVAKSSDLVEKQARCWNGSQDSEPSHPSGRSIGEGSGQGAPGWFSKKEEFKNFLKWALEKKYTEIFFSLLVKHFPPKFFYSTFFRGNLTFPKFFAIINIDRKDIRLLRIGTKPLS